MEDEPTTLSFVGRAHALADAQAYGVGEAVLVGQVVPPLEAVHEVGEVLSDGSGETTEEDGASEGK